MRIADTPEDFIDAIDLSMSECKMPEWLDRVDHHLRDNSWDITFSKMASLESLLTRPRSGMRPKESSLSLNASGVM